MFHLPEAATVGYTVDIKRSGPSGGKQRSRRSGSSIARLIAVALALFAGIARADLWGYLDEQGAAHFATEKLDERYQLFFKGETNLDAAARAKAAAPAESEDFSRSRMYQYVTRHPNAAKFAPLIERDAKLNGLDPALVKAVIAVESAFEPAAVSPKGALGLMQVTPDTGARYGVVADKGRSAEQKLLDPAINLSIGTRYLRDLLVLFANDLGLALAAYNAGEQTVQHYRQNIPPFPETQEYVKLVRQFYALYRPPPVVPPAPARVMIPRRHRMPE
ncbi:MAG TPA: lytic transglycosylase domain-containing protein [Casimicrobiaceae bacterium]|nr:lytic transglycosylase domain-containing protein [Casimicrobiaceae bacterium]